MEIFTVAVCLVILPVLAYLAVNLAVSDGGPLHGVYATPGRWYLAKYCIANVLLRWNKTRKYTVSKRLANYGLMQDKMKIIGEKEFFTGAEKGQNVLYINGCDQGGTARLSVRVAIDTNDRREVWFLLRLPGLGNLVLPRHPDCVVDNVRSEEGFGGAGLSCTPIEPLKIWRISFNGLCRVGIRNEWASQDDRPTVHVRCSLLWSVYTTFYDFSCDTDLGLATDAIAKEKWTQEFLTNLQMMHQDHYAQFGMIHGVAQVDDQEEISLLMRGVKERMIGQPHMHDIHTGITNYIVQENGTSICCSSLCTPGYLTSATTGYMIKAVGDFMPASSVDLPLAVLMENANDIPQKFTFSMQPKSGKRQDIKVDIEDTVTFYTGPDWRVQIREGFSRFTVNGVPGWGVCQTVKRFDGGRPIPAQSPLPRLYNEPTIGTSEALVLPLSARSCQASSLSGGKGSQLAKLVALRDLKSVEYEVPCGFCITTTAFRQHLQENKELLASLKELREVSCTVREGDLTDACKQTVDLFAKASISSHLKAAISGIFMELFEDAGGSKTYAVRSSAVGEDTSLTSAAGQMETFLGLKTLEKIFEAIQECWASNFTFQAVQYRRQYGQDVDSAMAVVVQEIVPAECAGVAFSRNPMTGNQAKIVINSNYGLGESVVSGVVEADTVTLHVDEGSGKLTIEDKKIGHKEETISVAEGGGTQTVHQTDNKAASCSISDDMCLRLGRVAIMLDKCFSDARDIEWAVVGETLYLLQARAITTFNAPSRYELLHEFDTGLPLDRIWMTTANIQEMCPGAVSPLTISNFFWDCDIIDQVIGLGSRRSLTVPAVRSVPVAYNHAFLSLTNLVTSFGSMIQLKKEEFGSMLFGETFNNECLSEGKKLNEPLLPLWRIYLNRLVFVLTVLSNRKMLEREFPKAVNHLTKRWSTAQEQYDDICRYPNDRSKMLEYHAKETHKSAIWQEVIGSMIKEYTDEKLLPTHIALLLSSCPNVESANVPVAMEEVCRAILKEGKSDSFQAMTQEEALRWLQMPSSGVAGRTFSDFLQRHGHRCVKEVALREKSWDMAPVNVIPSLQAILASESHTSSEKKRNVSPAEALDQLGIALPALQRKLLVNYIVPKAREGVAARESAKSMFIKINHRAKQAYWRLAELMVREGRLPDVDLLFFFTHEEIGRLLKDRSPALIARASRRRRVLPEQNGCKFDLITVGRPQPISKNEDFKTEFKLEGTPISQGVVKSAARVVTDLKDATKIKKGDILITVITDIGWSPYFPLIGGLITEIGGVLSHGAVVAREYGIPCVVNVKHATSIIQSGDTVIMDGIKGTVEKVECEVQPLAEAPPTSTPDTT